LTEPDSYSEALKGDRQNAPGIGHLFVSMPEQQGSLWQGRQVSIVCLNRIVVF